jgi:hypothetical protein
MLAFGFDLLALTDIPPSAATVVCGLVRERRRHDDLVRWLSSDVASEPGWTWPVGYTSASGDDPINLDYEGGDDDSLCV